MSETERPGATGDEEHAAAEEANPSPDEATAEDEGPDVDELDKDPAYNPDDEGLKGLKGG